MVLYSIDILLLQRDTSFIDTLELKTITQMLMPSHVWYERLKNNILVKFISAQCLSRSPKLSADNTCRYTTQKITSNQQTFNIKWMTHTYSGTIVAFDNGHHILDESTKSIQIMNPCTTNIQQLKWVCRIMSYINF